LSRRIFIEPFPSRGFVTTSMPPSGLGFCLEKEACSHDLLELKKKGELDETAVRRLYDIFGLGISESGEIVQDWET
jgi:hypothetical protein